MSQPFLITGMARSGTTLLDKLIDAHPAAMAISQPIPMLYRIIKFEFFKQNGISTNKYVLNDLFEENRYSRGDLRSFLKKFKISQSTLNEALLSMKGWSGQSTDLNKDAILHDYFPQELVKFYKHLLGIYNLNNELQAIGTKEILVEEFAEYYLENSIKVILVVRDPRDVITSLNIGKGTEYGGTHRPLLFHLRNWRKSIAVANTFKNHSNFLILKYEDLINRQEESFLGITNFLEVKPFPSDHFDNGIKGNDGKVWEGNSSTDKHSGINSSNTGKYQKYLDKETISYIEYICEPEMRLFGYELNSEVSEPVNFKELFDIGDCGLNPNMSGDKEELLKEKRRRDLLASSDPTPNLVLSYFYSNQNYQSLKSILES